MIDQIVLQLSPWQAQIMMLPLRRAALDGCPHGTPGKASRAIAHQRRAAEANSKTEMQIMAAVRDNPGITTTDVARKIGISKGYAHKMVHTLIDDVLLRSEAGPYGARPLFLVEA